MSSVERELDESLKSIKRIGKRIAKLNMPSPTKKFKSASTQVASTSNGGDIEMADQSLAEAAGTPSSSGDSTNVGFEYIHKPHNRNSRLVTFRNTIMGNSWGNAYKKIDFVPTTTGSSPNYAEIITPLNVIPVNQLSLYMSPAEYDKLPQQSRAVSCKVTITPKGFRTSFATAQNASTYSNSNHTIFGVHAIGLNKHVFGGHRIVNQRNPTEPMVVLSTGAIGTTAYKDILWGKDATDPNFLVDFPNCICVKRSLPIYWLLHVHEKGQTNRNQIAYGFPQLREHVTEWDFAGHVNKPLINYSYNFKNGIIKSRKGFWAYNELNREPGDETFMGGSINLESTMNISKQGELTRINVAATERRPIVVAGYDTNIEKPMMGGYMDTNYNIKVQPLVYVGIQPIEANYPEAGQEAYTNVQANWLIETELVVETWEDVPFTDSNLCYPWEVKNLASKIYTATEVLNMPNTMGIYG